MEATGFASSTTPPPSLASLAAPPSVRIAPEVAELLLGERRSVSTAGGQRVPAGPEISVDCLSSPDGELFVALPRSKGGLEWTRELVDDRDAIAIARAMVEGCGLRYLTNVQVKYPAQESAGPVLLEVNTRAASGLYQSCRMSGVNLPALALAMTLGERRPRCRGRQAGG